MQYKCNECHDTGSLDKSGQWLNCVSCEAATDRAALEAFITKSPRMEEHDLAWRIHQRALAMAPKQEEMDAMREALRNANHKFFAANEKLQSLAAPVVANGALTDDEGEALDDLKKAVLDGASDQWLLGFIRQKPLAAAGPDAALSALELAAEQLAEYCENMGSYNSYVDDVRAALSGAKGN